MRRGTRRKQEPQRSIGIGYDAIVIGSGITGGWAAKELTEKGLETLVLEAGRSIDPREDYVEHVPPWEVRFRGMRDQERQAREQPIQRSAGACDEWSSKFFVNDLDNPYSVAEGSDDFKWIRGRQVGGRSITWGRQSYRWSDLDFEANARDGHGVDWPIRYADLAPWYDHVETFAGICGQAEQLPQLPDGRFLPPIELNCAEQLVRERLLDRFSRSRVLTPARAAVLTRDYLGRRACHYCGPCRRGCMTRSYFSSLNSTLPAAERTGRMTLRPHSVVHSLIYDEELDRVTGVRVIDGESHETIEFFARVVFLCASALESTRILLNSKTPRFSDGLANSSGELGRNLLDHHFRVGANGILEELEDKTTRGRRPNAAYLPRFRNLGPEPEQDYLRGFGFQCGIRRGDRWREGLRTDGFGAEFKHSLRGIGPWRMNFIGFGETLPRHENYVEIDPDLVDRWGVPCLRVHMTWSDNELQMRKDMQTSAAEMLEAAGFKNIRTYERNSEPGLAIHEMGTARMGKDPKTSVLNGWNQAHDIPNLFVTDGSSMASTACQNPSLTYMALTARACDYAVKKLDLGEL